MQRQFTASVYIISEARVLLIHHRKLQMWLPPGGHVEPDELPSETAVREALEETGLEIELLSDEHLWVQRWNARSLPRPYLCLLEEIPAHGETAAHQHIDQIYLARPIGGKEMLNVAETGGLRWFTCADIHSLQSDVEIFAETKEVISTIFDLLSKEEHRFSSAPQAELTSSQLK
jgi:8-oxo-dGTP pyrophosphatase MutT (NUDIX family)